MTKKEGKKYYARFACRDWDANTDWLKNAFAVARLIKPDTKSTGFCFIELFETKEDAQNAYPDETPGILQVEETKEDKEIEQ